MMLIGHLKNSQTRAIMSILDACRIKFEFSKADVKEQQTNTQGNQGQDKSEEMFLKQRQIPMLVHNGYKILADMTKMIYYLYENFKTEILVAGLWPKTKVGDIVFVLEWYSTKLRPFMWEFYGIMTSAS